MPVNMLPVLAVIIDQEKQREFFWDSRLAQLRRTTNPHDFIDVPRDWVFFIDHAIAKDWPITITRKPLTLKFTNLDSGATVLFM